MAPGTDARAPMSAIAAVAAAASAVPAASTRRLARIEPAHTSTGPSQTVYMSGKLRPARACSRGASFSGIRGRTGWNTSPECAASWWAMNTTVRSASGSPISATTFHVER